jgi:hypothetical protein
VAFDPLSAADAHLHFYGLSQIKLSQFARHALLFAAESSLFVMQGIRPKTSPFKQV